LQRVHNEVSNLRGRGGPTAHKLLLAYLEWTSNAVRMLGNQISRDDLDHLVLTDRYRLLLSGVGTMTSTETEVQRVVNGLVSLELDERVVAFDTAIKAIQSLINRWSRVGDFVVPDTSFYINHEHKLRDADLATVAKSGGTRVHVLVPIVIVDELDGLKESKDKHVRWRAGHTLGVLDEVFANSPDVGRLRADGAGPDASGQGEVTIEMVFDPPGHVRLPINDDEIIDRTLAIEALADRSLTLLTYDTGQSTRARSAGLKVIKLSKEIGDEPAA
jgi:rRNA-processing protein FCF1